MNVCELFSLVKFPYEVNGIGVWEELSTNCYVLGC